MQADIVSFFDKINDTVAAFDKEGNIAYVNNSFAQSIGFKKSQMVNENIWQLCPSLVETIIYRSICEALNKKEIKIIEWQSPYNEKFWETKIFPSGFGVTLVGRDITERKKAEYALIESEDSFRSLFESSTDGIMLTIPDGRILRANPAAQRMLNMTEEEIKKAGRAGVLVMDKRAVAAIKERKKVGKDQAELTLRRKDGSTFEAEVSSGVFYDAKGQAKTSMILRDITDRKKAEKELWQSEERFFKVFDLNPAAMAITTMDGRFIHVNHSFERLTGYRYREALGRTGIELGLFVHPEDREQVVKQLEIVERLPEKEIIIRSKSGREKNVLMTFEVINVKNDQNTLSTAIDVTEQKRLQQKLENYAKHLEQIVEERTKELQEKERLVVIGQTAGMVGHDIRNPLQAIVSDTYLVKVALTTMPNCKSSEEVAESIDSIEKNVNYINKIVQDLQDYSRPITLEYSEVNLSDIFVDVFEKVAVPDSIKLSIKIKDPEKLQTDPLLLQRAIANLVVNAIQAMPEGGNLEICSRSKYNQVLISVRDTGKGIPDKIKSKIFTPMVTTKSKGQGLGLAVVKRIVDALHGTISFESEVDKGTKFIIELPVKVAN